MSNVIFHDQPAYKAALNGDSFWGRYGYPAGGSVLTLQIANPIGSGVNAFLLELQIRCTLALTFDIWKGTFISAAVATPFENKYSSFPVSKTLFKGESSSAGAVGKIIYSDVWAANETKSIIFEPSMVLLPGESISAVLPASAAVLFFHAQLREAA